MLVGGQGDGPGRPGLLHRRQCEHSLSTPGSRQGLRSRIGDAAGITAFVASPRGCGPAVRKMTSSAPRASFPHANRESAATVRAGDGTNRLEFEAPAPLIRPPTTAPRLDGTRSRKPPTARSSSSRSSRTPRPSTTSRRSRTPRGSTCSSSSPFDYSVSAGVPGADFEHPVLAQTIIAHGRDRIPPRQVRDDLGRATASMRTYGRGIIANRVRRISYSA